MSGIEFDSDKQSVMQKMQMANPGMNMGMGSRPVSSSKFVQWLMNKGIVSTEAAGQKVLLGVVAFNVVVTIIIIAYIL